MFANVEKGKRGKYLRIFLCALACPVEVVHHGCWEWRRFQVKKICVKPGSKLSLQKHFHRSEHWVVVEGTALVQINDETSQLTENESTYIPLGAIHRLSNPGHIPLTLIEVQTGSYLGEDDIVRFDDVYGRSDEDGN